jgi:hypothetical protein
MKYWLLAAACVAYALVLLVVTQLSPSLARSGLVATYGLSGLAGIATAFSFAPRDRLRWAWLSFGAGYSIAFASKIFVGDGTALAQMSTVRVILWSVTVFLLNLGSVTAFVLFARAWSGTGMAPAWQRRATLVFLAVALLIDTQSLLHAGQAILAGQPSGFGLFASVTGDIVALTLVGPIFTTAVALRGGLLSRPWLFLFAAAVCWMFEDIVPILPNNELVRDLDIMMRSMAVLLGGAAAVAQLMVRRDVRLSLREP